MGADLPGDDVWVIVRALQYLPVEVADEVLRDSDVLAPHHFRLDAVQRIEKVANLLFLVLPRWGCLIGAVQDPHGLILGQGVSLDGGGGESALDQRHPVQIGGGIQAQSGAPARHVTPDFASPTSIQWRAWTALMRVASNVIQGWVSSYLRIRPLYYLWYSLSIKLSGHVTELLSTGWAEKEVTDQEKGEERWSEVDRRWEGLLWRGFGIPDLIPPDRALAIVAERLGLELEGSEIPTSFRPEIATKLTDTFIRLAGDGQLDDVFLPTDLRSDRRDPEGVRPGSGRGDPLGRAACTPQARRWNAFERRSS